MVWSSHCHVGPMLVAICVHYSHLLIVHLYVCTYRIKSRNAVTLVPDPIFSFQAHNNHKETTMMRANNTTYDPYHYAWMVLNYFVVTWLLSLFFKSLLLPPKSDKSEEGPRARFKALPEAKRRNVVAYIIQLLVTTFVFIAQIYAGQVLLFSSNITDPRQLEWGALAMQSISILYIWELIYRNEIGFPLLLHHLVTIFLIQVVVATFYDTNLVVYLRFALVMGFHATFEQTSFVALFCFRMNLFSKRVQRVLFYISSLQTLVCKTVITVIFMVMFGQNSNSFRNPPHGSWGWFWLITGVPIMIVLYGTQVYASYILYVLGQRCGAVDARVEAQDGQEDIEFGRKGTEKDSVNVEKEIADEDESAEFYEPSHRPDHRTAKHVHQSWIGKSLDAGMARLRMSADLGIGRFRESVETSVRKA